VRAIERGGRLAAISVLAFNLRTGRLQTLLVARREAEVMLLLS